MSDNKSGQLNRVVSLPGAILLGLGSMLGTGVFVSLGFAGPLAGQWLPVAILIAAFVAALNALSSAQLAANYPVSGGTYEYGYQVLHPVLGFSAGWTFLIAKGASAAAASIAIAHTLITLVGVRYDFVTVSVTALIVIALATMLVLSGIKKTNAANAVIVSIAIFALLAFSVYTFLAPSASTEPTSVEITPFGFAEAIGLVFVAFTGYARIATLSEEIVNPRRNIPLAILSSLAVMVLLYCLVATAAINAVGGEEYGAMARRGAPLAAIASTLDAPLLGSFLRVAGVIALFSVLFNLILGLSRVVLSMGRRRDLPYGLARIYDGNPVGAVVFAAFIIVLLALGLDLRGNWSLSAFAVLIYYSITNLAATQLEKEQRFFPAPLAWLGLACCLPLAFLVRWDAILEGAVILAIGFVIRFLVRENARAE